MPSTRGSADRGITTVPSSEASALDLEQSHSDTTAQRRLFGIKAQLFVAFFAIAAMTALASGVAWFAFADVERSVQHIIADTIPGMAGALQLAERSAEIAAIAPALMTSASQTDRSREQLKLERRTAEITNQIQQLETTRVGEQEIAKLTDTSERITTELRVLADAVQQGLELDDQREDAVADLTSAHSSFLDLVDPLIDDAVFDLVISGEAASTESSNAITALVEGGVSELNQLLTINAEANLVAGLLAEAANVTNPALIEPIRERFVAASAAIERNLRELPHSARMEELSQSIDALVTIGKGGNTLFDVRRRELRAAGEEVDPLRAMRQQMAARVQQAHEEMLFRLTPMIDDAVFDLVIDSERETAEAKQAMTQLIDVGMNALHALLTVRAETNLAASLLTEASAVPQLSSLQPLRERLIAAEGRITRVLKQAPATDDLTNLRDLANGVTRFGDDLFDIRQRELEQDAAAASSLAESRNLAIQLGDEVALLVAAAQESSDAAAQRSSEAIAGGKLLLLVITGISAASAALIMLFHVVPRVVRPVEAMTGTMTKLAGGDTTVGIPGRDRRDEIGGMAKALEVFRDTAIEVQQTNLRELREARRRLSDAIESINEGFSLYDRDDRLIVSNSRYHELLYGNADETKIVPGMTFREIVAHAVEHGHIRQAEGRVEQWIEQRIARHRNPGAPHVQQRADGRWIQVSERRTDDGGTVAVYSDITDLKEREEELAQKSRDLEQLASQLAKYLSPQVYESIFSGRQQVKIASQRKKLTVFFSDVANFTETADRLESEDLTTLLNTYLTEMSEIALEHGATIDKYVGDGIMIFFGDPETRGVKEDALACVEMAIAMRERMKDLEVLWRDSGIETPLRARMGINTGYCTVGNFGSDDRMDYTIIGGGVNLASRLESEATPGEILISYETYAHVRDHIHCEQHGEVLVKGIAYPIATHRVIGRHDTLAKVRSHIREEQPHLRVDLDLEAMSETERSDAEALLRRVLDQLSSHATTKT